MQRIVDEVITTVGLEEHRTTQFRQLSGGQQKRLSLAIELITKPNFIFLDEPTSPLDPETTETMMLLFRRLADEGRIVVMVTHKFEKFDEMHQVAILTKGGRLAFFGPPREALDYFGCREPGEIYRRIAGREPEELNRAYNASPTHARYVAGRIAETEELTHTSGSMPVGGAAGAGTSSGGAERRFGFKQWLTLTRRYLEIKAQRPAQHALAARASASHCRHPRAHHGRHAQRPENDFHRGDHRHLVRRKQCRARNRFRGSDLHARTSRQSKIPSYVLSKFAVLSGIGLIQCALFVAILTMLGCLSGGDFPMLTLVLYLTLLAGVSMGLLFSAAVSSSEKAMSVLPLILIPQLLLGGFLKPLDDIYVNLRTNKSVAVADYERAEEAKDKPVTTGRTSAPPDPVKKFDGLGAARIGGDLMIARWAIEALAHAVSIDDEEARHHLPTNMTVRAYDTVLEDEPESAVKRAYRQPRRARCAALFGVLTCCFCC